MAANSLSKLALSLALLLIVTVTCHLEVANGQSICNVPLNSLMSCRPSVTKPNPTPPSAACCSALSHADLKCLCSYKNSSILTSLGIDPNLAMELPEKCNLPHPASC